MLILTNLTHTKKIHWECCFFFILLHVVDIYSFAHKSLRKPAASCSLTFTLQRRTTWTCRPQYQETPKWRSTTIRALNTRTRTHKSVWENSLLSLQWHSNTTRDKGAKSLTFSTRDGCGVSIHPHKMCWQGEMTEVWKTSQTNTAWQTIKPTSYMTNFQVSFPIKSK